MKNLSVGFILVLLSTFVFASFTVEANEQSDKKEMIAAAAKTKDVSKVTELTEILTNDRDGYTRAFAAWALGEIKDKNAVSALNNALGDVDKGVRAEAQKALDKLGVK